MKKVSNASLIWKAHIPSQVNKALATVGSKAFSLSLLPARWTPDFFVISASVFQEWLTAQKNEKDFISSSFAITLEHSISVFLTQLRPRPTEVIVRSSATSEHMPLRGLFSSLRGDASAKRIVELADEIWNQCRSAAESSDSSIPLLVHRFITANLTGHLSNERRISQKSDQWLLEFERDSLQSNVRLPPSRRFRCDRLGDTQTAKILRAKTQDQLQNALKNVSRAAMKARRRVHYEWCWDSEALWILQQDVEPPIKPEKPGGRWSQQQVTASIPNLASFSLAPNTKKQWAKVEAVRVFKECGLPTANIFVLEDELTIRRLSKGKISTQLKSDLITLLRWPVVIRTEVREPEQAVEEFKLLTKRTPTLSSLEDVIHFLVSTSSEFKGAGTRPSQYCFLFHHFIAATSGAFSLAKPGNPRVRIDSSWGIPETLSYFSHDSFEVDEKNRIRKKLRCKTHYIDVTDNGEWRECSCGAPWDWKQSVSDSDVRTMADYTRKIVSLVGRAKEIMFFVGVATGSGHPSCLPWVMVNPQTATADQSGMDFAYSGAGFNVSDMIDLERLSAWVQRQQAKDRCFIRLSPRPDMVRSTEFIDRVADEALRHKVPVQLQGSVLAHIYFVLSRRDVKVQCLDPFERPKRFQKFGKLVRDLIPEKIRLHGESVRLVRLRSADMLPRLKEKALEEALEFLWSKDAGSAFEEMADLLEVLNAACANLGRTPAELAELALEKRSKRGGFEQGWMLVSTKEDSVLPTEPEVSPSFPEIAEVSNSTSARKGSARTIGPMPRLRGKQLVIPLIPPTGSRSKRTVIPLPEMQGNLVVLYGEKDVSVAFHLDTGPESPGQLLLPLEL